MYNWRDQSYIVVQHTSLDRFTHNVSEMQAAGFTPVGQMTVTQQGNVTTYLQPMKKISIINRREPNLW